MKKHNELNKELLELILTKDELEILRRAYKVYKELKDNELKEYLLRRMDDVTSMVTFIGITYPEFRSEDYDALALRLSNLSITTSSLLQVTPKESRVNFLMDRHKTPYLLNSLAFTDTEGYNEINELLKDIAVGGRNSKTVCGELKVAVGPSYHILFLRDDEKAHIYDVDSNTMPRIKKDLLPRIEELLKREAKKTQNPILEKINDQIIYQTIHLNIGVPGHSYSLIKKSEKER